MLVINPGQPPANPKSVQIATSNAKRAPRHHPAPRFLLLLLVTAHVCHHFLRGPHALSYSHTAATATILVADKRGRCGERKWGNGWRMIPVLYGAIIRLHNRYYCWFMEGLFTSQRHVYCWRATKIIIAK